MPIWRRWWWELSIKARLGRDIDIIIVNHNLWLSGFLMMWFLWIVMMCCHSRWGSAWHLIIICDCETQWLWLWLNGNQWYWMILHNTYISYAWYYRYTHIQSCHSIERADFGLPPSWSGSLGWVEQQKIFQITGRRPSNKAKLFQSQISQWEVR